MGIKKSWFSMFLLVMGSHVVVAHAETYYPPEKIHCNMRAGMLACSGFNHQYLEEDETTASDMQAGGDFDFKIGEAHYSMRHDMCFLTYTYANKRNETVRLKRTLNWIRPDLENGHWHFADNWYAVCTDSARQCPLSLWSG